MKMILSRLLAVTVALLLCCIVPQAHQDQVRTLAADLQSRLSLPGIALAVGVQDKVAASVALGWADVAAKRPVAADTQFRIGSVSKLLTAATALRLVQAGVFDLDAPMIRYLPPIPEDKAAITARQVLGHLAGFRHYGRDDFVSTVAHTNVDDVLPRLLAMPLLGAPGSKYSYSSYGFNVLGSALQGATKREFRQLVSEQVTGPLGLTNTVPETSVTLGSRAKLYSKSNDTLVESSASDVTDRWPSGGFLSTAEDLVRFGVGFIRPAFLKPDIREAAFTSQRGEDGKETNVGLAWRIGRDEMGRRYMHHGGDSIGGRAFLLVYPDQGVAVAIVSNVGQAAFGEKEAIAAAQMFLR